MASAILDRKARDLEWSRLMRAAIGGDQAAYRRLLEELLHALRKMVRRGFGGVGISPNDIEDVVQEILLAIHLKRHTWDPSMPLTPWIAAIARNKMIDDLRRRRRRPEIAADLTDLDLGREDHQGSIAAYDLVIVLKKLPDRSRDIVRSVSIDGHSAREVATRLGMTEVAVRVVFHRSLKILTQWSSEAA
ncbi:MAG: sigma-70 family RNA polymerase sigma factor [Hyphomicrobium sp.]|uniref:sigma-70 family RNA polymerase sigma factor n=1 Tax=Hyphomicrobium sp. TaxID=82 RepID=UPI0039E67BB5